MMLIGFIVGFGYLTYAAVIGANYEWGPYLSPVYSTPYVPEWWKLSPAFLLLWIPAGFRLTCYYGRKAYYRSVFADPMNCAVEEPYRGDYKGETKLPWVLNNLHRYFLYFALALVVLHWYEMVATFFHDGQIYVGVGTVILLIDTLALTFYVFGCHSLRHLVGGKKRCLTACEKKPSDDSLSNHVRQKFFRYRMWKTVTAFNLFHNVWFWVSLFSIAVADLYIRLLAMGVLETDPHIIF